MFWSLNIVQRYKKAIKEAQRPLKHLKKHFVQKIQRRLYFNAKGANRACFWKTWQKFFAKNLTKGVSICYICGSIQIT
ncbi:MAG: hypothetical protein EAZ95_18345 [Bacteroidetes bacterium]|nr:MAG: hypothetical protein EAZ95_18345 [Bacteroidota bacterium]